MGKIDRVICKSISRFARNTEELLHMIRALKNLGVSIYFEDKDIDSDKLNMEMIITFPGMAAQQESEAISGNMRWSYRKRMEQGQFVCTCPAYGYDLIDGEMVINQAEAAIIRRTFDLYMKGYGFQSIAKLYNDEKVPRRYGKTLWHAHTIRYILTNEKYIGDSLTQKSYSTDTLPYRRLPNNGKYPKYYVKHNHEEIIDRDTFNAVQKLIAERKNEPTGKEKFPLSGKLRCAECGSTFRRQQLGDTAYWICMKKASGNSRCKSRRVKEDAVYDTFTKLLYKLKMYRTVLIEPLIETLQDMDYTDSQKDIRNIDKSIADYSAKQKEVQNEFRQKRVVAYCRVSTKQEEQLNSYETQRAAYIDMINKNPDWTLVKIFADKGITGTSVKRRDGFNKMIRLCKQGKADMIITKSISRFARNTEDCLHYTRLLKKYGVDVYFEEQKIHSMQPGAELYITLYGSLAQSESENISANVKWGKE